MNAALVRRCIYPLHERLLGRNTFDCLREMETTQWWSPECLRELQARKLRALLMHSRLHCPAHRLAIDATGCDPHADDPFDVLAAMPLLDKPTIRSQRADMTWADAPGGLHEIATGGSTGEPLQVYIDRRRQSCDKAARMRTHRWFGVDVGEPEVYLWGNPIEIQTRDRVKTLRDRLTNELLLSAFRLNADSMREYLVRIERFNPRSIFGYPSSLAMLADFAMDGGDGRLNLPRLAAVFATGESLDGVQRHTIASFFAAPVANGYGAREAGFLAHDCPSGSMHITDEHVLIEIVDEDGRVLPVGAVGEIIVTHLEAYAMPLIRYRTGDMGRIVSSPCACGRGLTCIELAGGRITDHLVATDGTRAHGLSLIYPLRDMPSVAGFQIHQNRDGNVKIRVKPSDRWDRRDSARIVRDARKLLGQNAQVTVQLVDEIPATPSGKFRCVVSEAAAQEVCP